MTPIRRLSLLLLGATACAGRRDPIVAPTELTAPQECSNARPPHALITFPSDTSANPGAVQGRIVVAASGAQLGDAIVELSNGKVHRQLITDSTGRFVFANIPPDRYRLRVRRVGFDESADSVTVSRGGASFEVRQHEAVDLLWCGYVNELMTGTPLTLTEAKTVSTEVDIPGGGRVRHTATIRTTADQLEIESRITSIGTRPAALEQLCYPIVRLAVLAAHPGIGPSCYSGSVDLAPGDTFTVRMAGRLRGKPGRYDITVHAIDPPSTDISLKLDFVQTLHPMPIQR